MRLWRSRAFTANAIPLGIVGFWRRRRSLFGSYEGSSRPSDEDLRRYPLLLLCRPMGLGKSHPVNAISPTSKKRLKKIQGDSFDRTSSRSALTLSQFFQTNYLRSHRRVGGTPSR